MRSLLVLVLLVFSHPMLAQLQIGFAVGYGTYAMEDLMSLQNKLAEDYPAQVKITESFPAYWYYDLHGAIPLHEKLTIGMALTYGSTGGRVHYKDYSGEIKADQLTKYLSIGFPVGATLYSKETFSLFLEARPTLVVSKVELKFYNRLWEAVDESSYDFHSVNLALWPQLTFTKSFEKLAFEFQVGFSLTLVGGKLRFDENKEAYLADDTGDPIKADWSGIRTSMGISYRFLR